MLSNKALVTLFFIILNLELVVSSGTRRPKSSGKSALRKKRRVRASKPKKAVPVLEDRENTVRPVEPQGGNTGGTSISPRQPVSQTKNQFETLIDQGKYKKIYVLGKKMKPDEFLKELCLVIKTSEQYSGIVDHLDRLKMVTKFYVYGDIGVVKGTILAEPKTYDREDYFRDGDLETALSLALKGNQHDRVIELLEIRKEITKERDELLKRIELRTSFELFVSQFIYYLAPWEDGTSFKRLLSFLGDELRDKKPDILDTLCQELLYYLRPRLDDPKTAKLLTDLIGQPSLLTSVSFAEGFLGMTMYNMYHSAFIKYGWFDTIEVGLKGKYEHDGGKELWRVIEKGCSDQSLGEFPPTEEALVVIRKRFPTKQQKEDEWNKENAKILFNKLKGFKFLFTLLPKVFWRIILEYAILLSDI